MTAQSMQVNTLPGVTVLEPGDDRVLEAAAAEFWAAEVEMLRVAGDYRSDGFLIPPGVYDDLPAEWYHAQHHVLSSSGARKLATTAPAIFKHWLDDHSPSKAMERGTAAHALVLGAGHLPVLVDADEWRTNEVKAKVAAIRAAGDVPLKPKEMRVVEAMAEKLRDHPDAAALLQAPGNTPEASLFWVDPTTGVQCRTRPDSLPPHPVDGNRMILPDYKSADDVHPDAWERAVAKFGYHAQATWEMNGVKILGLAPWGVEFVFVVQMSSAPYLVECYRLDLQALEYGEWLNRKALKTFAECTETGQWPGYFPGQIVTTGLPMWEQRRAEQEMYG